MTSGIVGTAPADYAPGSQPPLTPTDAITTFKFYEDAADKNKSHAWTLTAWILTLNAGVLGFAATMYVQHKDDPAYLVIESLALLVGLALCWFLYDALNELGEHIRHHWKSANRLADNVPLLASFIGSGAESRKDPPFPSFCRRLQFLAGGFAVAHVVWAEFAFAMRIFCPAAG